MLRVFQKLGMVAAGLVLAACGGGDAETQSDIGARFASAPMAARPFSGMAARAPLSAQMPLTATLDMTGLFNWAPTGYPQYFSGAYFDANTFIAGYGTFYYRYFHGSGNILAVLGGTVYVYGPLTDYEIYSVGALSDFTCYVYNCSGAGSLSVGGSANGSITSGGYYDYTIQLNAGSTYTFDLVGSSLTDPYLELYDPYGSLAAYDDDGAGNRDSRIVHVPSYTGSYTLRAKGYSTAAGSYTLSATVASSGPGHDGTVDWTSSFSADEIVEQSQTLAVNGRFGQGFTVTGGTLPVEIIFVAQYSANLYVTTADGLDACVNGGSFSHYADYAFMGQFGYQSFGLPAGSYGICVQNTANTSNTMRVEFQNQPTVAGFLYLQQRFATVSQTVQAGGRVTQPATVGDNYRLIVDGANSGGTFYTIPSSEQSNFLNGGSFQYYTSFSCSSGQAAPGLCELTGIGDYVIAYDNDTASPQSIVITGRDYVPD